jgi:predicted RNA binding protein YcfA (HicA-like mRNA interferase family)
MGSQSFARWVAHGPSLMATAAGGAGATARLRAPLTEAEAAERMLAIVREHDADETLLERNAEERRRRGITFRELAIAYLEWLEHVKGAKPSTLRDHRLLLAEPGQTYRRGRGRSRGPVMATLGDRPAREVTTREIEDLLRSVWIMTTERYLHARPAGELADRFPALWPVVFPPRNCRMPRSQREWIRALENEGWIRERGGKHQVKMVKSGKRPITLPRHKGRTYSKGLDAAIRRQAGL